MKYLIFIVALLAGCEQADRTNRDASDIRLLESKGYTEVKITAHGSFTGCGIQPGPTLIFNREFEAVKDGKKVRGAICASAFGDSVQEK